MTSKTSKPAPARKPTPVVPILGVRPNVTLRQSADYFAEGDVQRVRGALGFMFNVERHKAKSVREAAESMGISKSTADRAARAAAVIWRIGSTATTQDAKHAIVLVNALSAARLGKVEDYVKPGRQTPAQLQKQLKDAQLKATADMSAKREQEAKAKSNSADKTRSRVVETKDDKSKVKASAALLTGVKSGSKCDVEDVRTMFAQSLRIALESDLESSALAHEIAFALGENAASIVADAAADAAASHEAAPVEVKPVSKRARKAAQAA